MHRNIHEDVASDYFCPWAKEPCKGNRCMAWAMSCLEERGHCGLVPAWGLEDMRE